jgi:hypothetical protein
MVYNGMAGQGQSLNTSPRSGQTVASLRGGQSSMRMQTLFNG